MSAGGGDETSKNLDGGRLAGGIGAEHDKKFAPAYGEAQVIHGGEITEFLHQIM